MIRTTTNHPVIGCPECEDGILHQEWRTEESDDGDEYDALFRVCNECGYEEEIA